MDNSTYEIWLQHYKNVHALGNFINEALVRNIFNMKSTKYLILQDEMEVLVKNVCNFLDKNRIRAMKPKWKWLKDDETTWISSPKFAYSHLM